MAINFYANRPRHKDNTTVLMGYGQQVYMQLFGNIIAHKVGNAVIFNLCGWDSTTTRDRLNALGIPIRKHRGRLLWDMYGDGSKVKEINARGEYMIGLEVAKKLHRRILGITDWPNKDLRKEY